ncbi:uncharacterized protein LOC112679445 [Sipha flava]|uniref:Uncharacterized protein LOC112679445 n=1 Tax=Sipha flava TaxID=143950 RepID=A0A8B8F3Z6_9HEMI|nr:uncharacterized protein LOC112679445 [Sipha flava]
MIKTRDFYHDLANTNNLLRQMDTSNLPCDHPCYAVDRAKIPGLFKDETHGRIMYEFVTLRAKSYAYEIELIETIKAKGIRKHVIRNHLTLADHKRCLFETHNVDGDGSDERNDDDDDDDDESDEERRKRLAVECSQAVVQNIYQQNAGNVTMLSPHPNYMPYTPYRLNKSIRSFKHQVKTINSLKKP